MLGPSAAGRGSLHRAPRLGQALARQPRRVLQVAVAVLRALARLRPRPPLGDDADQALRQRIVDLARQSRPLVEDARLAGLRQQLHVQPRVLRQRGLAVGPRPRAAARSAARVFSPTITPPPRTIVCNADDREVERPRPGARSEGRATSELTSTEVGHTTPTIAI